MADESLHALTLALHADVTPAATRLTEGETDRLINVVLCCAPWTREIGGMYDG